jgi:hypothetical protein
MDCRRNGPWNNSTTCDSKPTAAWQSMQQPSGTLTGETVKPEEVAAQPSGQNSGSRQIQPINRINRIDASIRTAPSIPPVAFASALRLLRLLGIPMPASKSLRNPSPSLSVAPIESLGPGRRPLCLRHSADFLLTCRRGDGYAPTHVLCSSEPLSPRSPAIPRLHDADLWFCAEN